MKNPYKIGDKVVLLDNITNEYGGIAISKGSEVEVESLWESKYGMFRHGIIIKHSSIAGTQYGTRIENIKPTIQTLRNNTLTDLLDGTY